jgi:hypothetical protein
MRSSNLGLQGNNAGSAKALRELVNGIGQMGLGIDALVSRRPIRFIPTPPSNRPAGHSGLGRGEYGHAGAL